MAPSKTRIALTLAAMLVACQISSQAVAAQDPPEWLGDICPFECCLYREWKSISTSPVPVYLKKDDKSPVAFRLQRGQQFKALRGDIQVIRPGIMTLAKPVVRGGFVLPISIFRHSNGREYTLPKGKQVLLLAYLGEGSFVGWADGHTVEIDYMDGEISKPAIFNWWVNLRNAKGRTGWVRIRVEAQNGTDKLEPGFDGMDGCG